MSSDLKWYQKYRPKNLEEYIGNSHVKKIINKMIINGKLPKTLMFTGASGLGKTSIAFIISKVLKCHNLRDNGEPCDICPSCKLIEDKLISKGETPIGLGIHYVDITKANTVDEAKSIVNAMSQRGFSNETTIYILDEMQRASQEAQSCFLKIAEDTPDNIYIMLCTTNPEKIVEPLKNRFHELNISKPTEVELSQKIQYILQEEGVNYTLEGVTKLVKKSRNTIREAINRAELISIIGDVNLTNVEMEFHLLSKEIYQNFLNSCFRGNLGELLTVLTEIKNKENFSFKVFLEGFADYLTTLIEVKAGIGIENYTSNEITTMRRYNKSLTDLQIIQIVKLLKEYDKEKYTMDFKLTSLGAEIMEIIAINELVVETPENVADSRFVQVTQNLNESVTNDQIEEENLTTEDVSNIYDGASVVETDETSMEDIENIFKN